MTSPDPQEPPPVLTIEIPEALVPGVYGDFANIWHTQDVFIFDFAALKMAPGPGTSPEGEAVNLTQGQIVARVKVPPAQVFEIMKALENQLSQWEQQTGNKPAPPPIS